MTAWSVWIASSASEAVAKENLSHRYSQIFTEDLKFLNDQNLRTLNQCLSVKISGLICNSFLGGRRNPFTPSCHYDPALAGEVIPSIISRRCCFGGGLTPQAQLVLYRLISLIAQLRPIFNWLKRSISADQIAQDASAQSGNSFFLAFLLKSGGRVNPVGKPGKRQRLQVHFSRAAQNGQK